MDANGVLFVALVCVLMQRPRHVIGVAKVIAATVKAT